MKGLKRVLGLVALSVTLLPSRAADACSCVPPDARILPSETTLTVPSNTRIWVVGTQYCGAVTLADGQGSDVGLTYTNFDPDVRALTPAQELTVGARYTITCEAGQVTHFTVTDEADWRAPTTPLVEIGEHTSYESTGGGDCGDREYVELDVVHNGDMLFLDIAGRAAQFETKLLQGELVEVVLNDELVTVGNTGDCGRTNWDFYEQGDAIGTRVAAVDLAGNVSPWSAAQTVRMPTGGGFFGCAVRNARSANASAPLAALGLGLFGLLVLRRRRPAVSELYTLRCAR